MARDAISPARTRPTFGGPPRHTRPASQLKEKAAAALITMGTVLCAVNPVLSAINESIDQLTNLRGSLGISASELSAPPPSYAMAIALGALVLFRLYGLWQHRPRPEYTTNESGEQVLRELRVLVVGEVGDGKSTLVNTLRDPNVEDELDSGLSPDGISKHVVEYCGCAINGMPIMLLDSPGVGDKHVKPLHLVALIEKKLEHGQLDGIIVTSETGKGRTTMGARVVKALLKRRLVNGHGADPWKSVILVGTKSDKAGHDLRDGTDLKKFFFKGSRRSQYKGVVHDFFGLPGGASIDGYKAVLVNAHKAGLLSRWLLGRRDGYDELRRMITQLPAYKIQFEPSTDYETMVDLAEAVGIEGIEAMQEQLDKARADVDEVVKREEASRILMEQLQQEIATAKKQYATASEQEKQKYEKLKLEMKALRSRVNNQPTVYPHHFYDDSPPRRTKSPGRRETKCKAILQSGMRKGCRCGRNMPCGYHG